MQIVLYKSSEKSHLWPLAHEARPRQFLRLFPGENNEKLESMVQRLIRQIRESGFHAPLTIMTQERERDYVLSQIGNDVNIVTDKDRSNSFSIVPIISEYFSKVRGCPDEEVVIVVPYDRYTGDDYLKKIHEMVKNVENNFSDFIIMGVFPQGPYLDYGYILPKDANSKLQKIQDFQHASNTETAQDYIGKHYLWNGGVYVFKVGAVKSIINNYSSIPQDEDLSEHLLSKSDKDIYDEFTKNNKTVALVPFYGECHDINSWDALTAQLNYTTNGNVIMAGDNRNTHVINELNIPISCVGTDGLVVAASPDGILIADKSQSDNIYQAVNLHNKRPMFEERRWGEYKVLDSMEFPDGYSALTKLLHLNANSSISYQRHSCRDEIWTFIDGEGEIVLDGERKPVKRGDVVVIPKGQKHALMAHTSLSFIEVQKGSNLVETDIERFDYKW